MIANRFFCYSPNTQNTPSSSKVPFTELRSRARALVAYVGRIPYRLPSETYARLTQFEMEAI